MGIHGVTTPNIVLGQGVILFSFGATSPLIGDAEEVVEAEPIGAFNRDPMDLVVTTGDRLVVNDLLEYVFLSHVQLESLLEDLGRVPLSEKAPIFNENPPIVGRPQDIQGPATQSTATMGATTTTSTTPTSSSICRSSKGSHIVCLRLQEECGGGGGGGGWVGLHHSRHGRNFVV